MLEFFRHPNNPLLLPRCEHDWESVAVFNPCVIKSDNSYHMAYRAQGNVAEINGHAYSASCIGYACGDSIDQYQERRRIISPDQPWDRFGCEDPRVTFLDGKYYIFYTALSTYPFSAQGIRIGEAITTNIVDYTPGHTFQRQGHGAVSPADQRAAAGSAHRAHRYSTSQDCASLV
jgi:beta-1,2-mannobiose phosphorylase / 1,2-beta-oligomannan phosphorylase